MIRGRVPPSESNLRREGKRALSAKCARSRNYTEGLSHSSSAAVIAYQRSFVSVAICPTLRVVSRRPTATQNLPRPARTIGGCINVSRSRRRKEKKGAIIISTTRGCRWIATEGEDERRLEEGGRKMRERSGRAEWRLGGQGVRGSMGEKERERGKRSCLGESVSPSARMHE